MGEEEHSQKLSARLVAATVEHLADKMARRIAMPFSFVGELVGISVASIVVGLDVFALKFSNNRVLLGILAFVGVSAITNLILVLTKLGDAVSRSIVRRRVSHVNALLTEFKGLHDSKLITEREFEHLRRRCAHMLDSVSASVLTVARSQDRLPPPSPSDESGGVKN